MWSASEHGPSFSFHRQARPRRLLAKLDISSKEGAQIEAFPLLELFRSWAICLANELLHMVIDQAGSRTLLHAPKKTRQPGGKGPFAPTTCSRTDPHAPSRFCRLDPARLAMYHSIRLDHSMPGSIVLCNASIVNVLIV
jgi:hypothetical protein